MGFKIESSLLDACALAILHRGDTYGYEITQEMKKSITVSESTLYPVLRRLQSEELCRTYDQPYQGRNRRYYSITEKGEAKLLDYLTQWYQYRNAIQTLLEGPATPEVPEITVESGEAATPEVSEEAEKPAKEKKSKKAGSGSAAKNSNKSKKAKNEEKETKEGGAADEQA